MNKKRGMLLVVLLLFLVVLSSSGLAMEINVGKWVSIGGRYDEHGVGQAGDNDCDNDLADQLAGDPKADYREEWLDETKFSAPNTKTALVGDGECDLSQITALGNVPSKTGLGSGCWFLVIEADGGTDNDDFAWVINSPGKIYDSITKTYPRSNKVNEGGGNIGWMAPAGCGSDNDADDCVLNYWFYSTNALICSDDELWHKCDLTVEQQGTLTWANDKAYNCTKVETSKGSGVYVSVWQPLLGYDYDKDGYTDDMGDCANGDPKDPNKNLLADATNPNLCPQQAVDLETGDSNCKYPDNSKCAICINPGAPEVCGDELNNDCLTYGTHSKSSLIGPGLIGDTPDNCHNNKAACMQTTGDATCTEDILCEVDEEGKKIKKDCEDIICPATQKNIYNQQFSWIQTGEEEGYCCGFNGIEDLGVKREGKGNDKGGQFICLNKDEELAGMDQDLKWDKTIAPPPEPNSNPDNQGTSVRCPGDWCWLNAFDNAKYSILTLKKPSKPAFDVVSNNYDWYICNATTYDAKTRTIPAPDTGENVEDLAIRSNHYYCYKEGDHYSWAECTGKDDWRGNDNLKGRLEGEGLFTLPLRKETAEGIEDFTKDRYEPTVEILARWYDTFYGKGTLLDFSGYDYLNFMVRFVSDEAGTPAKIEDKDLPLDVELTIRGPEDQIFFQQNVLSYVINNPLFSSEEQQWMHVRVPLPKNLKNIKQINFDTGEKFLLGIRNIYLSKENEEPLLCSGINSKEVNNWITDADYDSGQTKLTGETLCTQLYGKKAWLGTDEEIDQSERGTANCCGNDPHEYYAGSSPEQEVTKGTDETPTTFNRFGCWNSEVIASGATAMNVEFEVEYWGKAVEYTTKNIKMPGVTLKVNYDFPKPGGSSIGYYSSTILQPGSTFQQLGSFSFSKFNALPGKTVLWFKAMESADQEFTGYAELVVYDLLTNEPVGKLLGKGESVLDDNEAILVPPGSWYIEKGEAQEVWNHPLAVVAKLKEGVHFPLKTEEPVIKKTSVKQTYSCIGKDKCTYPLPDSFPPPGEKKYKIINPNPELYELFFIAADENDLTIQTLITPQNNIFNLFGNIQVQKVAQQILFYNKGVDAKPEPGFYGCQAASFLEKTPENLFGFKEYKNMPYCSVVDNWFCSYSVEREFNQERFTTINSWSDADINYVGYDKEAMSVPDEDETLAQFYERTELVLDAENFPAKKRNFSTSVLPARNFISNPEFEYYGAQGQIPHWDIFKNNEPVKKEEHNYVDQETRVLSLTADNEKLRSERIAVPKNSKLHFSQTQACKNVKGFLFDKDGKATGEAEDLTNIETGDASYLVLEFTGYCKIEKPVLQLKDEFKLTDFSTYKPQPLLENFNARSGQACCPQDFCWNGYACVRPMTESTSLTEYINEERNYRCIAGKWVKGDVKLDWNEKNWGFCKKKEQCFVLPTGKDENTAGSFYEGKYPICIDSAQYILDHYCDNGDWTSRTKFVASKLVEVAEDDDYILYCSPYAEVLLEFKDEEDYLGGEVKLKDASKQKMGELAQKPQLLSTCYNTFKSITGTGNLVQDQENTCVNNLCVLKYKDGKQTKLAFATTLNRKIDNEKSFLNTLIPAEISPAKIKEICKSALPGKFTPCDLSGLNLPNADLFYSQDLNAIIYAKEGLNLEPGLGKKITQKITQWFNDLFGLKSKLSDEKSFLTKAKNFRDIYILKQGEKKVRALKEVLPGKQALIAEYDNFKTPVCDYINNIKLPLEAESELLEELSGMEKVTCSVDGSKQKVEVVAGLDFFWPQLTGKLRVS